ncbi:hypothetical protein QR680_012022 [Steinernema hermaphroditum]|uniref:DNA primase n=1 Tax=Steinernema hermaphroditum TaxID=289476 RepID=A0AA39I2I5_9BILA|nr:hypothetical protein QR680_012022 [Steinernema hermaphroditum]
MALNLDADLKEYYKYIFPFKPYIQWLHYDMRTSDYFLYREFCLILENDVHLRYRNFDSPIAFEKELCKTAPYKLDLGAIYNFPPGDRLGHPNDFYACERELVFDIDLTDYDEIRTCCRDAKVCEKCWRFAIIAVKVLDGILEETFGYQHRLWVFSGRRGVHCWVADAAARELSSHERAAVADHVTLVTQKIVYDHYIWTQAYNFIMASGHFEQLVMEQKWLENEKTWGEILEMCECEGTRKELARKLDGESAEDRWKVLKLNFDETERRRPEYASVEKIRLNDKNKNFLKLFAVKYAYPRLDSAVSVGLNHLLKSPFCIHPKTGNVAVPLDVEKIDSYAIDKFPTIRQLVVEVFNLIKTNDASQDKENHKPLYYKHTSLAPYVETFEKFVKGAVKSDLKKIGDP